MRWAPARSGVRHLSPALSAPRGRRGSQAPAGHTGSTSSLLGALQYVFAGVTGAALGLAHDGTLAPFGVGLLLCVTGALIAFVVAARLTIDMAPASL